ncbi:MAG: transcriptional repressor [Muribaculaceae bacterium]|nr:transcriptional repressor [Muribaculaceae bacterium]
MNYTTQDILDTLAAHGIKPSAQRIVILRYLMEHRIHPTVDEIHTSLQAEHPTLSRTTVYNTLKLLAASGAIRCLEMGVAEGARWDYAEAEHAHFVCTRCGSVTDMPLAGASFPTVPGGYEVESVALSFKGVCPQCREQ